MTWVVHRGLEREEKATIQSESSSSYLQSALPTVSVPQSSNSLSQQSPLSTLVNLAYATTSFIPAQYFDSGASDHITGDLSSFDDIEPIEPFTVQISDESKVQVTHRGPVTLPLVGGHDIHIAEVFYSEAFGNTCLFSVPQFTAKGAELRFKSHKVQMLDLKGFVVATGTMSRSRLYRLNQLQH